MSETCLGCTHTVHWKILWCQHLFPSLWIDDIKFLLGVDGVDNNLSRVVGARCTSHKVFCPSVAQCGDSVTWKWPQVAHLRGQHLNLVGVNSVWLKYWSQVHFSFFKHLYLKCCFSCYFATEEVHSLKRYNQWQLCKWKALHTYTCVCNHTGGLDI